MNTTINNEKANTEMNTTAINNDSNPSASQPARPVSRRVVTGLKVGTVMLSLIALGLSYRAANQAVALYGVLNEVQTALANEHEMKFQYATSRQIAETKTATAGL